MFESFHKQDDIFKNIEEVPASVPVFEGYLYWYSDKQKWKWRLFRFDGLSFICLSSRKVKLPRDTPIEQDDQHDPNIPSPTSPLLATPKQPYTPYTEDTTIMASHYQLPSWSVNLLQVTSISVLTLNDKPQHRHCFSIRTKSNKCYLLKARKQKDLDRWLFVLTKAWHWSRLSQPSPPPQLPPLNTSPSIKNDTPPTPPPHFTGQSSQPNEYEAHYKNPTLSLEKEKWIDEWRDSLRTMAMPSPMCHQNNLGLPIVSPPTNNKDDTEKDAGAIRSRSSSVQQRQRPVSMVCQLVDPSPFGVKVNSGQERQGYDVHYFQDANDTSTHHNSNYSGDRHSSPLLQYHRSTRGRNVQIVTENHHQHHVTDISPSSFNNHSPLYALSKVESTHDVYKLQSTRQCPSSDTPASYQIPSIYSPHKTSSTTHLVVAPSLPPVPPNYTLFGSIMSSSTSKKPLDGDDLGLVFYPSRSTPTQPYHSLVNPTL